MSDYVEAISARIPPHVTRGWLVAAVDGDRVLDIKRCIAHRRTKDVGATMYAQHPQARIVVTTVPEVLDYWANLSVEGAS